MGLSDLIPIIQMSIGPVILISGVGLLLLSMTNRLGRVIDRSRELSQAHLASGDDETRLVLRDQITILYRRSRIIRSAIGMAGLSVMFVSLLIVVLFIAALTQSNLIVTVGLLFIAGLASLLGSLIQFMRDVNLSLRALDLEIGRTDEGS